jgi:Transglycosylase SLT domain
MTSRCVVLLLAALLWLGTAGGATATAAALESVDHAVCRLIERSAHAAHLPVPFLTRVIWRESSFRAAAVSPVGAEGIAQFMPGTAQERGLADPFDPEQAIPKAANLLAALRRRFGSLGIAAAAYNAGPARVTNWLHGHGDLPAVTHAYVRFVTQQSDDETAGSGSSTPTGITGAAAATPSPPPAESCLAVTAELRRGQFGIGGEAFGFTPMPLAPWGVQLAGSFSKPAALAAFERERRRYARVIGDMHPMIIGRVLRSRGTRPFYQVRLPAATRAAADALCRRILSVGGACVALRS